MEVLDKEKKEIKNYRLDLNGLYQEKNILTALTSVELLKNQFILKEEKIKSALSQVKKLTGLHGRWEVIGKKPTVVLDVAHNEDGIKQLIHQLHQSKYKDLHIVFGMVKDKDPDKVLNQLPITAKYYFTKAAIPRALPEDELLESAKQYGLVGKSYPDVNKALKEALSNASEGDMIVVCGSVFVVAEVNLSLDNL